MSLSVLAKPSAQQLWHEYRQHPFTFTEAIPFNQQGLLLRSKQYTLAPEQVVWMPIIPHKELAKHLPCYQHTICSDKNGHRFKGVRCCRKISAQYQRMENDTINYIAESPPWAKIWRTFTQVKSLDTYETHLGHKINFKHHKIVPNDKTLQHFNKVWQHFYREYQFPLESE